MPDINERIVKRLKEENSEAIAEMAIQAIRLSEQGNIDAVVDQLRNLARVLLKEGNGSAS